MNIYKNLLFLGGYFVDPRMDDHEEPASYADGYGNRVASKKFFGVLGHAHADDARATEQHLPCVVGSCG